MTWSQKVRQRDNCKCVVCGSKENLQAHHLLEKHYYPQFANNVDNGITLCRKCHRAAHNGSFQPYSSALYPLAIPYEVVWAKIKAYADSKGESINGFVNKAIDKAMEE